MYESLGRLRLEVWEGISEFGGIRLSVLERKRVWESYDDSLGGIQREFGSV